MKKIIRKVITMAVVSSLTALIAKFVSRAASNEKNTAAEKEEASAAY